jgi:hypothetical protein
MKATTFSQLTLRPQFKASCKKQSSIRGTAVACFNQTISARNQFSGLVSVSAHAGGVFLIYFFRSLF